MGFREVMKELESAGTAQNRKVYARHGVGPKVFGVSYAHFGKLAKRIRQDHALAEQLWASGNHDARVLATMVADPTALADRTVEGWAKDLDNYVLTDALSGLVARSPLARKKMEKWIRSRKEWIGSAGWNLLGSLASRSDLDDRFFVPYLETIEKQVEGSKNRVRHAMNMTLICIGARSAALEKRVIAAVKRIGKIEVDHGVTGCKTPEPLGYIKKVRSRKKTAQKTTTKKKVARKPPRRKR